MLKLMSSIEVSVHAEEDEIKITVADTGDKSHEHITGLVEHLLAAFSHFIDGIKHCRNALSQSVFYHDDKSVRLNPIGQHHKVKVWYHGTKPSTFVNVTVKEKGMYIITLVIKELLHIAI